MVWGKAQESSSVSGLIADDLKFSVDRTHALAQRRHALVQLFDR